MRWRVKVTAFVVSGMQIINLTLMNMNHIIKLLFLCLFFATACSQEEMNEVLKNHAEMEGQANSIEELCKNMNRDIVALKLIINSSESGDYITGFKELADGSGYTISFSKVVRLSSRMAKKETTVKKEKMVRMVRMVRMAPMAKTVRMVPTVKTVKTVSMGKTDRMVLTVKTVRTVPMAKMARTVPTVKMARMEQTVRTVRKETKDRMGQLLSSL